MTATLSPNGHRPDPADLRAAAREAYSSSLADGVPLSGAALGRQFGMSDRWGRARVLEAHRQPPPEPEDSSSRESGPEVLDPAEPTRETDLEGRDPAGPSPEPVLEERDPGEPAKDKNMQGWDPDEATREATAEGRDVTWIDKTTVTVVALVAFAASYGHMWEVAELSGEPTWIAMAFPITVDGLVLAALRRGRQGRWWLALAVVVSVAANVLSRYPDLAATAGPIVSAWPPLALFGTHRLTHTKSSGEAPPADRSC